MDDAIPLFGQAEQRMEASTKIRQLMVLFHFTFSFDSSIGAGKAEGGGEGGGWAYVWMTE
jgi:hypothetical protein